MGSSASTQLSASASNTNKLGDTTPSHVRVHVQTHTEIDRDVEKERNVVQLELQDWQAHQSEKGEKLRFEDI